MERLLNAVATPLKYMFIAVLVHQLNKYFNFGLDKAQLLLVLTIVISFENLLSVADKYMIRYVQATITLVEHNKTQGRNVLTEAESESIKSSLKLFFGINYFIFLGISYFTINLL